LAALEKLYEKTRPKIKPRYPYDRKTGVIRLPEEIIAELKFLLAVCRSDHFYALSDKLLAKLEPKIPRESGVFFFYQGHPPGFQNLPPAGWSFQKGQPQG
jgi:hypothetical protein